MLVPFLDHNFFEPHVGTQFELKHAPRAQNHPARTARPLVGSASEFHALRTPHIFNAANIKRIRVVDASAPAHRCATCRDIAVPNGKMVAGLFGRPAPSFLAPLARAMAGHSKWKTIQHRKGALDAKKSLMFAKIAMQMRSAAHGMFAQQELQFTRIVPVGGADLSTNTALAALVGRAHAIDMPKANIERAISKGVNKNSGEEIVYEGYGQGSLGIFSSTK